MQGLREAIHRTGYYPEVVADGVVRAVSGEDVVSFFVHHEPTFERDEIRRHLTVVVLTPSRLVVAHTDEHAADDMIAEPYTSTSTEAISLTTVRSVVVTRMVTNPTGGPTPAAEAVVTIGWGGVSRIDLEPAGCQDPECDADHGYTGVLASDDFSIRASATADGVDAVAGLLSFAESLPARPGPELGRRSSSRPTGLVRSSTSCRRSPPPSASATATDGAVAPSTCPEAPAYVVFLVDGLGVRAPGAARRGRAVPLLPAHGSSLGTAGVPSTTATSLTSLGTALAPGAHGLVGFTSRMPGHRPTAQRAGLGQERRPEGVAAARHRASAGCGHRGRVTVINKREFRDSGLTVAAHRGARLRRRRPGGGADRGRGRAARRRPSLTYLYDGDLDWTGHRYGVASAQWLQQLVMVDAEAEQLRDAMPARSGCW